MLNTGSVAPDFKLPDQNGQTHSLKDFHGKWIVLYFYPKDMTPGCTTEACNFRDSFPAFQGANAVIIGISKDSVTRHEKFAQKYDLPFLLLSDESGTVCESYDVWKKKSMYGKSFLGIIRMTFLIDPEGKIAKIYPKVSVKEHANEVMADLKTLQK